MDAKYLALLDPITPDAPCGDDLEYHPGLLVLQTRAVPPQAAQYGDFTAPVEAVNWREMEAELLNNIFSQGRDIRALALLLRCRIRQAGAQGAREGLSLLAELLLRFPNDVHPQRILEGEEDLAVRANALSLLTHGESVLDDLRDILIDGSAAARLSLRDVERAHAIPRPYGAPDPESIGRQLAALRAKESSVLDDLAGALVEARRIAEWAKNDLGMEAPDLGPLLRLLSPFDPAFAAPSAVTEPLPAPEAADEAISPEVSGIPTPVAVPPSTATPVVSGNPLNPASRQEALALVRAARFWFEGAEPSSPVADLLRQAEHLTGKPYGEIADAIPLDLLARWRDSHAQ